MDNMNMDGCGLMCVAMWLGGILLIVGLVWLVIWLVRGTNRT